MTIRVGIIGAGAIAREHCSNIARYKGAQLTAVADISRQRREEIKRAYGMVRDYARWQDLAADPGIDAVTIALPNYLHAPVSLAALRAGKHVLLEKPFAMNCREAQTVAAAARRARKVLMVGMNQRFNPEVQALRAMVARGELGEIYHVKTYWLRRMGCPRFDTWFVSKKLAGGGCLLDIGVHALDRALYLIDNWEPVAVTGRVYNKFGGRGIGEGGWGKSDRNPKLSFDVDDFATALVRFRNGATLELNVSWVLHQEMAERHNVELFGTEAGAALAPLKLFRLARRRGEYEVVTSRKVRVPHPYADRHANWLDAIAGRDRPLCTLKQSLIVQRIIDAIYAGSAGGKEMRL